MKINRKDCPCVTTFKNILVNEWFLDGDNTIAFKVSNERAIYFTTSEGFLWNYDSDEKVIPVDVELVVTPRV